MTASIEPMTEEVELELRRSASLFDTRYHVGNKVFVDVSIDDIWDLLDAERAKVAALERQRAALLVSVGTFDKTMRAIEAQEATDFRAAFAKGMRAALSTVRDIAQEWADRDEPYRALCQVEDVINRGVERALLPSPAAPETEIRGVNWQQRYDEAMRNGDTLAASLIAAEQERDRLREALEDANQMCRSAAAVVARRGEATNWSALADTLSASLRRQHEVMYPGAALSPAAPKDWRPIETAPRDGTFILIWCDEVYKARFDKVCELWFFDVDGCAVDPSHWRPLPTGPSPSPAAPETETEPPTCKYCDRTTYNASGLCISCERE